MATIVFVSGMEIIVYGTPSAVAKQLEGVRDEVYVGFEDDAIMVSPRNVAYIKKSDHSPVAKADPGALR